jgi:hypothetical protein
MLAGMNRYWIYITICIASVVNCFAEELDISFVSFNLDDSRILQEKEIGFSHYIPGRLNDTYVNIRKFPDINAEKMGQIQTMKTYDVIYVLYKSDCLIEIEKVNYPWYYCYIDCSDYNDFYGWICAKYIDIQNDVPILETIIIDGINQNPAFYFSSWVAGSRVVEPEYYKNALFNCIIGYNYQNIYSNFESIFTPEFRKLQNRYLRKFPPYYDEKFRYYKTYEIKNFIDNDFRNIFLLESISKNECAYENGALIFGNYEYGLIEIVLVMCFENDLLDKIILLYNGLEKIFQ